MDDNRGHACIGAVLGLLPGCGQRRPIDVVRASGDQHFLRRRLRRARDEYAEIVSQQPGDWQVQCKLGLSMIETRQYDRALVALETAYTAVSLRGSADEQQQVAEALACAMFMQKEESRLFAFLRERATATAACPPIWNSAAMPWR